MCEERTTGKICGTAVRCSWPEKQAGRGQWAGTLTERGADKNNRCFYSLRAGGTPAIVARICATSKPGFLRTFAHGDPLARQQQVRTDGRGRRQKGGEREKCQMILLLLLLLWNVVFLTKPHQQNIAYIPRPKTQDQSASFVQHPSFSFEDARREGGPCGLRNNQSLPNYLV